MLASILKAATAHAANNSFFISGSYYTYGQLIARTAAAQQALRVAVRNGEKFIGILANNDFETYSSVLGILFSGVAYVPLNPNNPMERSMEIIDQVGIRTIVSSRVEPLTAYLEQHQSEIKIIHAERLAATNARIEVPRVHGGEAAYMLFTSGSTGVPKGIPISFSNIEAFIDAFCALGYDLSQDDRFLQMFDLTFDLSVMSYLVPLTLGACVYPVDENEIKYLAVYKLLADHEITFALMVPSMLAYMRPYFEDIKLGGLRYSVFCGEALYEDITREWSQCAPNARIQNVYGPTEATIFCLAYDWNRSRGGEKATKGIVSIGKPMKHTKAIVVDDALVPAERGIKGELCLSGGQLTSGYWNNPEKNKSAFFTCPEEQNGRFYRTGDLAYVDREGDFVFCGRTDYQVKIQGYRVELHEIEHYARQYGQGYSVAAVAHENRTGQTVIHLFVENGSQSALEMTDFLKTKLPPYMIPAGVTSLDQLPLNSNGKIDRKKLVQLLDDG